MPVARGRLTRQGGDDKVCALILKSARTFNLTFCRNQIRRNLASVIPASPERSQNKKRAVLLAAVDHAFPDPRSKEIGKRLQYPMSKLGGFLFLVATGLGSITAGALFDVLSECRQASGGLPPSRLICRESSSVISSCLIWAHRSSRRANYKGCSTRSTSSCKGIHGICFMATSLSRGISPLPPCWHS
jgi:hypothetical protein